jgi:hypothetical protein
MTYTPEQRKAALAMLIANEWSCVDLACHVTALRDLVVEVISGRSICNCGSFSKDNHYPGCLLIDTRNVLAQTAPKESHHAD